MKKILSLVTLLGVLSFGAKAATVSSTITAGTLVNLIPTNQLLVSSVVLINSSATNATVTFYDSPRNTLLWTNSAYTSRVVTVGNKTNIYTNFLGTIETNMYTNVIIGGFVTNGLATNTYSTLAAVPVPANGSVTFTPDSPLVANFGLTASNSPAAVGISATVTYSTAR